MLPSALKEEHPTLVKFKHKNKSLMIPASFSNVLNYHA